MKLDTPKLLCLESDYAKELQDNRMEADHAQAAATSAGALADPTRIEIADTLSRAHSAMCVADIAWVVEKPLNVVSHHLRLLDRTGMATCERKGKKMMYQLTPEANDLLTTIAGEAVAD